MLVLLLRAVPAEEVGREEDKTNMAAVNARVLVFRLLECSCLGRGVGKRGGGEGRGSMLLLRAAALGHDGGDAGAVCRVCPVRGAGVGGGLSKQMEGESCLQERSTVRAVQARQARV